MIKSVILAAGMARRLQPLTNSTPKCLLQVGGKALLDRTLESIKKAGLKQVVLVTGFEADQIKSHVKKHHSDLQFEFIHNDLYSTTNNIYSLWLAREALVGHSLLLLDSDLLFHPMILNKLLQNTESCLALRATDLLGAEEIKVRVNDSGVVAEISKTVSPADAIGESLGIELFSQKDTTLLFEQVIRLVEQENRVNDFYELAFEQAIIKGMSITPVNIGEWPCMEIDTPDDLNAASSLAKLLDNQNSG